MKAGYSNRVMANFSRKERALIEHIDHPDSRKEAKVHCDPKHPCWDCPKCVPARFH